MRVSGLGRVGQLLRTVVHLRPRQVIYQLIRRWPKRLIVKSDLPAERQRVGVWTEAARKSPRFKGGERFEFLSRSGTVSSEADWFDTTRGLLWTYNLHYFDDINAAHERAEIDALVLLVDRWVDENPPGSVGWDAYPTSLRLVNWVKFLLAGGELSSRVRASIAAQARWLCRNLEFHLLGNHLWANAKALYFCSAYFQSPEFDRIGEKALRLLRQELGEQQLADGGHFERSAMYHAIFLEDLLDLYNLQQVYPINTNTGLAKAIESAQRWLCAMTHPDGNLAFFNDATFGIAPTKSELSSYAERLGLPVCQSGKGALHLEASGFFVYRATNYYFVADIGDIGPSYQPGHAHAETFSFELSCGTQRVFVNSGVSTYDKGMQRGRERATSAHNTLVVDGQNSSEVWGGFRVGRRARVVDSSVTSSPSLVEIEATHDGYRFLSKSLLHHRHWSMLRDEIQVRDEVTGDGTHEVGSHYLLHPSLMYRPEPSSPGRIRIVNRATEETVATIVATGNSVRIDAAHWYPGYGVTVDAQRLTVCTSEHLPICQSVEIRTGGQA